MVRIGSEREHLDLVIADSDPFVLTAVLTGAGLEASCEVQRHYADSGFGDLVEFFAGLEQSWRGWDGQRAWASLEGELSIGASHTDSHVVLGITLARAPIGDEENWTATLDLTLGAGEELSSAAAAVRSEFGRAPRG